MMMMARMGVHPVLTVVSARIEDEALPVKRADGPAVDFTSGKKEPDISASMERRDMSFQNNYSCRSLQDDQIRMK